MSHSACSNMAAMVKKTDNPTILMTNISVDDYLPHFEIVVRDSFADFLEELGDTEFSESLIEFMLWAYAEGFLDCMTALMDVTTEGCGIEIGANAAKILKARKTGMTIPSDE